MTSVNDELRPPVLLCDREPVGHVHALGPSWTVVTSLELPAMPWDLANRRWVWAGTVGAVSDGEQAVRALSRGVGLVIEVDLGGRDRHRLLEDLYALGAVRTSSDPAPPPDVDPDQAAVLDALATGATLTEAAVALHLSRRTANRRLAEARARLGVNTTAEAIRSWTTRT